MDPAAGVALIRVVGGLLIAAHGTQKLFGWFNGGPLDNYAAFFDKAGYRPGRPMVVIASLTEISAGCALALGLLTPLSAAAATGTMLVACSTLWSQGLWASQKGFELPLTLGVMALSVGLSGPGRWSLDHLLGFTGLPSWTGAFVVAGTVAASVSMMLFARWNRQKDAHAFNL